MLHSLWIAPVLFYPCPENEPDVRPLQAELKFNLRAVSCIRPVQNSHEPKAPPNRTINRIGMQSIARSSDALASNNPAIGELRITSPVQTSFLRFRSNDALPRQASIAHANSSSTMSMNSAFSWALSGQGRRQKTKNEHAFSNFWLPAKQLAERARRRSRQNKDPIPRGDPFAKQMVELNGIEPMTSSLQSSRSPN